MTDSTVTGNTRDSHEDRDDFARANDPLLELSRIFGFEQPATPHSGPAAPHSGDEPVASYTEDTGPQYYADEQSAQPYDQQPQFTGYQSEADAELSLERELLSDFDEKFAADFAEPQALQPADWQEQAIYSEGVADNAVYQPEPTPARYLSDEEIFASLESDLSYDFAEPESAQFNAPDNTPEYLTQSDNTPSQSDTADFAAIGREPQFQQYEPRHEGPSQDYVDAPVATPMPASVIAPELSLEDELAFLLQDPQPQHEQDMQAAAEYSVAKTDFAPLFDAPEAPVSHFTDDYSVEQHALPEHNDALVDDEFYAVPEVSHPPYRDAEPLDEAEVFNSDEAYEPVADVELEPEAAPVAEFVSAAAAPSVSTIFSRGNFHGFAPAQLYGVDRDAPVTKAMPVDETVSAAGSSGRFSDVFNAASENPVIADSFAAQPQDGQRSPEALAENWSPEALAENWSPEADVQPETEAADDFFNSDDFAFTFDDEVSLDNELQSAQPVQKSHSTNAAPFTASPAYTTAASSYIPAPDVESLAVLENKVEQTQALDLPEIDFSTGSNDSGISSLESEFAEIFSTISVDEGSIVADSTSEADRAFENILQDGFADYGHSIKAGQASQAAQAGQSGQSGMRTDADFNDTSSGNDFGTAAAVGLTAAALAGDRSGQRYGQNAVAAQTIDSGDNNASRDDYFNHWAAQGAQTDDFDKFDLGQNFARDAGEYDDHDQYQLEKRGKPLLWASVAAAALLVFGGGYYALKSGGVVGGEPVIIHADNQPVKIQPENPGGAIVPNQDKAVYDQVSGTKPVAPQQQTLINTEEQPVDVGLLQGSDAEEDRLFDEQLSEMPGMVTPAPEAEQPLITPRTVKTMVVRPDGTIVASSDVAPVAAEPAVTDTGTDTGFDEASRLISQNATPERLTTETPVASAQSAAKPRIVQTQTFTANGEQVVTPKATTPAAVPAPVVPSRPAEQPVTIVGNVSAPVQQQANAGAAVTPSANVPAGTWFIQVASQPSAELAQKNYVNLTSRYGNVIGGRGVDIKKADIAGKGTYYRVRIPAGSKAEAGAMCERLKSAGGSCFPTM